MKLVAYKHKLIMKNIIKEFINLMVNYNMIQKNTN